MDALYAKNLVDDLTYHLYQLNNTIKDRLIGIHDALKAQCKQEDDLLNNVQAFVDLCVVKDSDKELLFYSAYTCFANFAKERFYFDPDLFYKCFIKAMAYRYGVVPYTYKVPEAIEENVYTEFTIDTDKLEAYLKQVRKED